MWGSMHHKYLFTLAGIFLAVAVIVPTVVYNLQAQQDLKNLSDLINDPSQGTGTNSSFTNPSELSKGHENTTVLVIVIEVVFVSLFIVMVYLGINHYHGQLDKPKKNFT